MFLTFSEVILVQDPKKRRADDDIVYVKTREKDNRTLWPDVGNQKEKYFGSKWNEMQRYGTIYQDTSNNWCIVPDVWSEEDADMVKRSIAD